ncbi:hypothetical protein VE03_01405 [Pseudogymnoascus sp. 23342-1-I1]|nr:hypothetical protein VE03_01405 [Pseudogymnoascus sp. 23342-1-I1]
MVSEKWPDYPESTFTPDAWDDEKSPLLQDEESQLAAPPRRCPYLRFTEQICERLPTRV